MADFSITVVDILVVLVVLVSAGYAVYRGLMRETLSIFSWVAASFITLRFYPNFRPLLRDLISPDWLADLAVFIGMFLIVLVPLSFASFRFGETVKRSEVGPVDRTLGLVFGVVRGLVIVGFAYVAFISMAGNHPRWLTKAVLFPVVQGAGEVLLSLLPDDDLKDEVHSQRRTAERPAWRPVRQNDLSPSQSDAATYGAGERRSLDSLIEATEDRRSSR